MYYFLDALYSPSNESGVLPYRLWRNQVAPLCQLGAEAVCHIHASVCLFWLSCRHHHLIVNGEATGEETIVTITSYICSFIITVSLLFLLQKKAQKMLREELYFERLAAAESRCQISTMCSAI